MMHVFELARRSARLRAPLLFTILSLSLGACDSADRITNTASGELTDPAAPAGTADADAALEDSLAVEDSLATAADPTGGQAIYDDDGGLGEELVEVQLVSGPDPATASPAAEGLALVTAFRGGIPFGAYHVPGTAFGSIYNGSITGVAERALIAYLESARRAGARVMLAFSGSEKHFRDANMAFNVSKWKARVARYRGINVSSYIKDGTLIAHYLMDEPHDPRNWGGRTVSRATIDELAKYSKQLWPTLPTAVRSWPKYLKGYNYRYLDAAWAQYAARFGSVPPWLSGNVRDAKAAGLALVVGMNTLAGSNNSGLRGFYTGMFSMSANQLRSFGGALLSDAYPCAFLGWKYDARYNGRADIKSAMAYLAGRARAKATKSCRADGKAAPPPGPPPPVAPSPPRPVTPRPPPAPGGGGSASIVLRVSGRQQSRRQHMILTWSGVKGANVDVYRNGARVKRTPNDGRYMNSLRVRAHARYTYKVCRAGTSTCSRAVTVAFK